MFKAVTRGIEVTVESFYLADRSEPERGRWVFAYRVTIVNRGVERVQLVSRHWRITDARGRVVEIKGEGVVGEQPWLAPGQRFQYTSGTPMPTATGFMAGSYGMVTDTGEAFAVVIPTFPLDVPVKERSLH